MAAPQQQEDGAEPGRPLAGTAAVPPTVLVLGGIASVQFGAAIATTLFDEFGAAGTSTLRIVLAALILMAVWRPNIRGLSREAWKVVVIFGLTLGAMNFAFYESLDRIPLGTAVTIEFLGPLGVALALSRKASHVGLALLAAAGIVLVTHPWDGGANAAGVALAMTAGACWAAYILIAQRASGLFSGSDGVTIAMAVAAVMMLVPGLLDGGTALFTPQALVLGAGVALLSSVIPYSLETEALRRMDARVFGVLMSLEPAVGALAGFLLIDQRLGVPELAGIVLVVLASIGVTRTAAAEV